MKPPTILLAAAVAICACMIGRRVALSRSTVQTVPHVDLDRYAGLWYEIARYPNSFQRGCRGTTATYDVRGGGKIGVVNSCRNEDGTIRQVKGKAWPIDDSNARLKVSFFWPLRGDYWIIELGERYDWAVVATPNRKLLWILSRSPQMDGALYQEIMERIRLQGFDPEKVMKTPQ